MIAYIVLAVIGIILIVLGRMKKKKLLLIVGIIVTAVGAFLTICTLLLVFSTSHSEPNPGPYADVDGDDVSYQSGGFDESRPAGDGDDGQYGMEALLHPWHLPHPDGATV